MGDPILAMHRHSRWCYELSSLRTGNLRDQLLRATALVERLLRHGLIDADADSGRGLLVIGGGAAGVCATLRASALGVPVCLAEKAGRVLTVQRGVRQRWIDPVEYDWPHPHWRAGHFPAIPAVPGVKGGAPLGRALPLSFRSKSADQLIADWHVEFHDWCHRHAGHGAYGAIKQIYDTEVKRQDLHEHDDGVSWAASPQRAERRFGAALACTGFAPERVTVSGRFKGQCFWADDSLTERPLTDRILVSGAGDSAMQDLQRAATNLCGKVLFDALGLGALPLDLAPVLAVEDTCRRLLVWGHPGQIDTQLMAHWHQPFDTLATQIWSHWRRDPAVLARVEKVIKRPQVSWVMKHTHPSPCHALNRLLSLLVVRLLKHCRNSDRPVWREKMSIQRISAAKSNHKCTGLAEDCAKSPHQVVFDDDRTEVYDHVVIRHGFERPSPGSATPFFENTPISVQMVPSALL